MPELKNKRHERFSREYLVDSNATRASISAGYAENSAAQTGWYLLRLPKVVARIAELRAEITDKLEIKAEDVLSEVKAIAYANIHDFLDIGENGNARIDLARPTRAQFAAVESVQFDGDGKIRLKLQPKLNALVKLGEHLGLWKSEREKQVDAMSAALDEINRRGSVVPVVQDFPGDDDDSQKGAP